LAGGQFLPAICCQLKLAPKDVQQEQEITEVDVLGIIFQQPTEDLREVLIGRLLQVAKCLAV
jgi:hypothetical protein